MKYTRLDYIPKHYRSVEDLHRWQIVRLIKEQSVAEHMFQVAHFAHIIATHLGYGEHHKYQLMCMALTHDLAEMETGDIPSPLKKAGAINREKLEEYEKGVNSRKFHIASVPENKELEAVLKIADLGEAALKMYTEVIIGNIGVNHVFHQLVALYEIQVNHYCDLYGKSADEEEYLMNFLFHSLLSELTHGDGIGSEHLSKIGKEMLREKFEYHDPITYASDTIGGNS